MVRDGVLHAVDDELDALLDLGELFGQGGLAELDAGTGLVDEVDGLVGQKAIGNVAGGVRDRERDRVVGVADGVKLLVLLLDSHDDLDRVLFVRRRNLDGLEAPLERTVLLDRLAILGRGGGADALDLATAERRLKDVGGVERAFSRTRADQRVQLVDEDDGVLVLHQLLHDRLEPLLELAAVLGAGDDQREIEREDALVGEEGWDLAVGDLLGQAFDDRGLTNARLADQDWIVLGAAAQDLDDAIDLGVTANQRIELLVHGRLGEVARELGEHGLLGAPGLLGGGGLLLGGPLELFADGGQTQPRSCRISAAKHFSSRSRPSSRCSVPMCLCESLSASSAA